MRTTLNALALLCASTVVVAQDQPADQAALIEAGRRIYQDGVLPNGEPLKGRREEMDVSGPAAACILCHRRSGMGAAEGLKAVPPVVGEALFGKFQTSPRGAIRRAAGIRSVEFDFKTRPAYDESTLVRALREGVSTSGHRFDYLMPRYALGEADLAALFAYLRSLPSSAQTGATGGEVQLATIIAPDTGTDRRAAFLEVLRPCIAERSPGSPTWRLNEWALNGPPETWEAQLHELYARQPVFAAVSGLAGDTWVPVHRFCESTRLPCLFPNTDAPGDADEGVYNFYFSKGTVIEAEALARYLIDQRQRLKLGRVVQVAPAQGPGAAAAATLRRALKADSVAVEDRSMPALADGPPDLLSELRRGDVLVLWLRAPQLAALTRHRPPRVPVFISGLLGGLEQAPLPAAWRKKSYLTYPVDAPGRWELRARFNLRSWLARKSITPGDERLQGSTLAACAVLAESMYRLQGVFVRDYLVEMVEASTSAMGNTGATAPYPRFLLGTNQRYASKGSYIVRFADPKGTRIAKVSDWIVP